MNNLYEAFKELDLLEEDVFEVSDDGVEKLKTFFDVEEDEPEEVDIIDTEAETEEDLEDSYVGKIILDCCVCHTKIYKNKEDIKVSDDEEVVNVDEECPFCFSTDGYKIVGQVAEFEEKSEDEEEVSEKETEVKVDDLDECLKEASDNNRFVPKQRTALDGKVWWCVYDTKENKWSTMTCHGKYKTKKDCLWAIDRCNKQYFKEPDKEIMKDTFGMTDKEVEVKEKEEIKESCKRIGNKKHCVNESNTTPCWVVVYYGGPANSIAEKKFPFDDFIAHKKNIIDSLTSNDEDKFIDINVFDCNGEFLGSIDENDSSNIIKESYKKSLKESKQRHYTATVQFAGLIGSEVEYDVVAHDEEEAHMLAMEDAEMDLEVIDIVEDDEDIEESEKCSEKKCHTKKLQEKGLTKAQRYNRMMDKIFNAYQAQNNRMADFLKAHGVSDEEIVELKQNTGLGKNALDDKMTELGIRDEFFRNESCKKNIKEELYRGAKGVKFIWHGTQSDPELEYKGKRFNYWDIEDALWEDFLEETGHKDSDSGNAEVEKEFDKFVQDRAADYLEDVIAGGYFEESCKSKKCKKKIKEYIDEFDSDFEVCCNSVANSLEYGLWHGMTRSERSWGLEVNGGGAEQFSPAFADVISYEVSYPVRDGYFSIGDLDCIIQKSSFSEYIDFSDKSDREMIKDDLINVGCSKEDVEKFLNDEISEIEFFISYKIDIDDMDEIEESCKGKKCKKKLNEEPIYSLEPQHDNRKSFYGKAQVEVDKDKNKLYSYDTLVAEIKDGKPVVYGTYSQTTLRHIKDWLQQNGFEASSKAQIERDYMQEALSEDFKDVSITTDKEHMEMTSDENGKVTITTEPVEAEKTEESKEVVAPISDEEAEEIERHSEEEKAKENEDEIEFEIDDFSEKEFDELGEKYFKKAYNNVNKYHTTNVEKDNNRIKVEGLIKFNSGKEKKTSFILEAHQASKNGKCRFVGDNCDICAGRKAFTVNGKVDNHKFISESLSYDYNTKDNKTGKKCRVKGTVSLKK